MRQYSSVVQGCTAGLKGAWSDFDDLPDGCDERWQLSESFTTSCFPSSFLEASAIADAAEDAPSSTIHHAFLCFLRWRARFLSLRYFWWWRLVRGRGMACSTICAQACSCAFAVFCAALAAATAAASFATSAVFVATPSCTELEAVAAAAACAAFPDGATLLFLNKVSMRLRFLL